MLIFFPLRVAPRRIENNFKRAYKCVTAKINYTNISFFQPFTPLGIFLDHDITFYFRQH